MELSRSKQHHHYNEESSRQFRPLPLPPSQYTYPDRFTSHNVPPYRYQRRGSAGPALERSSPATRHYDPRNHIAMHFSDQPHCHDYSQQQAKAKSAYDSDLPSLVGSGSEDSSFEVLDDDEEHWNRKVPASAAKQHDWSRDDEEHWNRKFGPASVAEQHYWRHDDEEHWNRKEGSASAAKQHYGGHDNDMYEPRQVKAHHLRIQQPRRASLGSYNSHGPTMIMVAPGEHAELRGANETWAAIQADFYQPASCVSCDIETLFCIEDAAYILCPRCKVISPNSDHGHGIGMGFTIEDLAKWQAEYLQETKAGSFL